MKKLILMLLLIGCSPTSTKHVIRHSPDGKDSVAFVRYYDGQQFTSFFMSYENFKVIYDSVGYEGCYEYYLSHELPLFWRKKYATYK